MFLGDQHPLIHTIKPIYFIKMRRIAVKQHMESQIVQKMEMRMLIVYIAITAGVPMALFVMGILMGES